jgi:uncharacterized DUF497 family protein
LTYNNVMRFGWDPPKSDRNTRERGLPFAVAMALFDGPTLEVDDTRHDYGERRIIAYGVVAGRVLVCVYHLARQRGGAAALDHQPAQGQQR